MGRNAYHRLSPAFKEVVDRFRSSASSRGLKEKTIADQSSCVSTFLLSMQEGGLTTMGEITEDDVLAYFTDDAGGPAYSGALTGIVVRALSLDLGDLSADAARVASYVPRARDRRKNVQYLRPEEIEAVRAAIEREGTPLGPLERAVGTLLLHTGLRASDIAELSLADIDWDRDEIGITQRKTGPPLRLPPTAPPPSVRP